MSPQFGLKIEIQIPEFHVPIKFYVSRQHWPIRCVLTNYLRYTIKLIMADVGQIAQALVSKRNYPPIPLHNTRFLCLRKNNFDRLIIFAIFSIGLQRFGFGTYIAFIYIDLSTKACIKHLPQLSINNVTAHLKDVRPTIILISQRNGNV